MDEELKTIIKDIQRFEIGELKRERGDFQFTDISKEIDNILSFVKDISQNEDFYTSLPDNLQQGLKSFLQKVFDVFNQIKNFNPAIPNPQDTRNSLAEQIRAIYRENFLLINQMDVYRLKTAGGQANLTNITKQAKQIVQDAQKNAGEVAELLKTAKKTTSKITLYEYMGVFHKASLKYLIISIIWLSIAVI